MSDPPLNAELRQLRDTHHDARSRLTTLTRVSRGLSIALTLVLVGFLAALYGQVTAMYDPTNFEAPIQREAENLLPTIEPQLISLWEETAPVYGELALAKFEEALPVVQQASLLELDHLRHGVVENAEERVNEALERIARKHSQEIARHLPRLSTPEGADELAARWTEAVEADLEQVVLHFHDLYIQDIGDLEATLQQFFPNDFERMSEDQLFRQFVHLWLMKADRWALGSDDHVE